jgi:hypothetical protein
VIHELCDQIWRRPLFQADYHALLKHALQRQFANRRIALDDGHPIGEIDERVVRRLVQSATHFAATDEAPLREAAYRIAVSCWILFGDEYPGLLELSHLVLARLGNFPAVDHLFEHERTRSGDGLPLQLWMEVSQRREANSVSINPEYRLTLTDFQRRLWKLLEAGHSAAITAPTSAGKSYALQHFLARASSENREFWGLYIVPTRALINQVSAALSRVLQQAKSDVWAVSTIPVPPEQLQAVGGFYVLTQERTLSLLEVAPTLSFGVVVIDEAQLINDGARGILLQSVIDRTLQKSPSAQVLFSSPQTENLELFGELFGLGKIPTLPERESPVAQNLIFVETNEIIRSRIEVSARAAEQLFNLGSTYLDEEVFGEEQALTYLSWALGQNDKNLIYAGGQALCERVAEMLTNLIRERSRPLPPATSQSELNDLSAFIADHVHPRYALAASVRNGIAFHYGNMPSLIRRTIEDFFDEGHLQFLICTSTLLHGINLPAKNLFLYNPTKGDENQTRGGVPITATEFWNLAGRAGRLGKEFEGNVFIIEPKIWLEQQYAGEKDQTIKPALQQTLVTSGEELLEFIKNEDHPSGSRQALESTFVRLYNNARAGQLEESLTKILGPEPSNLKERISSTIMSVVDRVDIPLTITERNPAISVLRQHEMLEYLRRRAAEKGSASLIPLHPLGDGMTVYQTIVRLFSRIHRYFEKSRSPSKFFAQLALRWMRGESLRKMIDGAYSRAQGSEANNPPPYGPIIRKVMRQIERDLRFRYVKYTHCYVDLLVHVLRERGEDELVASIPTLSLYLELGASSQTMISLIGLGMSRMTAGIVADKTPFKSMERAEAERWLRSNWRDLDIPTVSQRELTRLLVA